MKKKIQSFLYVEARNWDKIDVGSKLTNDHSILKLNLLNELIKMVIQFFKFIIQFLTFWVRMDHIWSMDLIEETTTPKLKGYSPKREFPFYQKVDSLSKCWSNALDLSALTLRLQSNCFFHKIRKIRTQRVKSKIAEYKILSTRR